MTENIFIVDGVVYTSRQEAISAKTDRKGK